MENRVIGDRKYIAESVFMSQTLLKYMTQELSFHMPVTEAENLYYFIGMYSGEDYCYNFLNLEDSQESLLKEIESICEPVCFSKISIYSASSDLESIEVSFSPLSSRNGKNAQQCRMRCQFLKGFISGVLSAFTGKPYNVGRLCDRMKNQDKTLPCMSKFSFAATGDINGRT